MADKSYNADDLKILEGLEAVRMRPGMYIGSTGVRGLHHVLWEIVDNSVDEAANGYADEITVTLHADGSASVEDNGRGMPTDVNTKAVPLSVTNLGSSNPIGSWIGLSNFTGP